MSGLLGQMIPQEQRRPFDANAFQQQFLAAAMQGMGQDQVDRMNALQAQAQQQRYNANKAQWDDMLQRGEELPRDPSMYDPQTGEFVPAYARYANPVQLQKDDGSFYETKFQPAGLMMAGGGQAPWQSNPNWLEEVQRGYQQYGPGFLATVF